MKSAFRMTEPFEQTASSFDQEGFTTKDFIDRYQVIPILIDLNRPVIPAKAGNHSHICARRHRYASNFATNGFPPSRE
ncbi:MAG: hypothetical protein RLZZ366_851 [Pseudomonadota bacterium]